MSHIVLDGDRPSTKSNFEELFIFPYLIIYTTKQLINFQGIKSNSSTISLTFHSSPKCIYPKKMLYCMATCLNKTKQRIAMILQNLKKQEHSSQLRASKSETSATQLIPFPFPDLTWDRMHNMYDPTLLSRSYLSI